MPATTPAGIIDADGQDEVLERIHALEGRFVTSLDHGENEISILCGNPRTEGLAYSEIAASLLQRCDWKFVELEVMVVAEAAQAPIRIGQRLYDAVAKQILTKLATYKVGKAGLVSAPRPILAGHVEGTSASMPIKVGGSGRTL